MARRKRKLTDEEINRLNKMFEEIEMEQQKEVLKQKAKNQCDSF